jgi:hypothetical protein
MAAMKRSLCRRSSGAELLSSAGYPHPNIWAAMSSTRIATSMSGTSISEQVFVAFGSDALALLCFTRRAQAQEVPDAD